MSDEKRLYFRIKSAGSSNYRGSVFLLPEFTRVYPRVYLHGSSAGECVLTCFGVYPREPLPWPITGGRGLLFSPPAKSCQILRAYGKLPIMSIKNPTLSHFRHLRYFRHFSSLYFTLAHFRHFIRRGGFSSLFTLSPLYICRESSTNQPFLCKTNPILSAVGGLQMNVSSILTTDYENKFNWTLGQNKPNSNPIKPNSQKAKMNVNSLITKDYRKKDDFEVRINKPNFVNGPK